MMTQTADAPLSTFHRSLKPLVVEEAVDYYFFRRLAHWLVPVLHRLGFSPNGVTTLSLVTGLLAAFCVWKMVFVPGAVLALVAIVFDCCDGQLARLTGKSSPLGRAMDGTFDLIWVASLWLAIYNSPYFAMQGYGREILALMALAGLSMMLHCWIFDGIKVKYLEVVRPEFDEQAIDFHQSWQMMKDEFRAWRLPNAFFAFLLALQTYFFVRGGEKRVKQSHPEWMRQRYEAELGPVVKGFTWLGEGTHNALVILGVLCMSLSPVPLFGAFVCIAVPMNLWGIYLYFRWRQRVHSLSSAGA